MYILVILLPLLSSIMIGFSGRFFGRQGCAFLSIFFICCNDNLKKLSTSLIVFAALVFLTRPAGLVIEYLSIYFAAFLSQPEVIYEPSNDVQAALIQEWSDFLALSASPDLIHLIQAGASPEVALAQIKHELLSDIKLEIFENCADFEFCLGFDDVQKQVFIDAFIKFLNPVLEDSLKNVLKNESILI